MNWLEIEKLIYERAPLLAEQSELKRAEKLRKEFIADYPRTQINSLRLDDFVIGKGRENRSFCYRLERELHILGSILGATAIKFGVYYGKDNQYHFAKHWGARTKEKAFKEIKQSIHDLLLAASQNDLLAIQNNRLSPMFKGKLLFIYFPENFAPVYSKQHLEYFLAQLNIKGVFTNEPEMQQALMKYRSDRRLLRKMPPCLYMQFLYDLFGYSPNQKLSKNIPLLTEAVNGAIFIESMPTINRKQGNANSTPPKKAAPRQEKHLKQIGDRGEEIVLEKERQRLNEAGRNIFAKKVRQISLLNDGAGYDILSFDEDGTERRIEVKATVKSTLEQGFYITANEVEKASNLKNHYIYFVFSAMSRNPRIFPMKEPMLGKSAFKLKAITYHAMLK